MTCLLGKGKDNYVVVPPFERNILRSFIIFFKKQIKIHTYRSKCEINIKTQLFIEISKVNGLQEEMKINVEK